MALEMKRKLMIRDLGNPKDVLKAEGKIAATGEPAWIWPGRMIIGTIVGNLTKIRTVVNGAGDEVENLIGEFRGINRDGEVVVSADTLALPGAWSGLVTDAFREGFEKPLEFALEVGVMRSKDTGLGWTWALNPIVAPTNSDAIGRLLETVKMYREELGALKMETKTVGEKPADETAEKSAGRKKAA